mmetsp:Transcript_10568/g.14607  ORF Transcript_10568/g.14607 Transcript_10568/m.14607 type:complete len:275 (+) Transcript_10568:3515-4339(+)
MKKSIWEINMVEKALEREGFSNELVLPLVNFLSRNVQILTWSQVDWTHRSLKKIPQNARRIMTNEFVVRSTIKEDQKDSGDESTSKLIIRIRETKLIETVIIRHQTLRSRRVTVCVSSQVGCAMNCSFCATGSMGFLGDLTQGEILEQFLYAKAIDDRCSRVVFMGMGEPLNNYNNVLGACRVLLDNKIFSLGKVTVSTVGISKMIQRLADDEPRLNLAISLHAPTQSKRQSIMPAAEADPLPKLVTALDYYVEKRQAISFHSKKKTKSTFTYD